MRFIFYNGNSFIYLFIYKYFFSFFYLLFVLGVEFVIRVSKEWFCFYEVDIEKELLRCIIVSFVNCFFRGV